MRRYDSNKEVDGRVVSYGKRKQKEPRGYGIPAELPL